MSSLKFYTVHCEGGPIAPTAIHYEDTGTPFTNGIGACGCHALGGDGYLDLQMQFNKQALVAALGLKTYPEMSFVKLSLIGTTSDGCSFVALDCVRVQKTGN